MRTVALAVSLILSVANAQAAFPKIDMYAGWSAFGGELFKYAHNPWFLENIKVVNYCVAHDDKSFSASRETVERALDEAIAFWLREFENWRALLPPQMRILAVNLGTQTFKKMDCPEKDDEETDRSEDVRIRFKFGYGTLNKDEIKYLANVKKYVGVTIQKGYNENKKMSGRGMIYIASDLGEFAYDDNGGKLLKKAWKHYDLLKYALIHEIGHVYGFPHGGDSIMSEAFLDQMLNKARYKSFLKYPISHYLVPYKDLLDCGVNDSSKAWFGIDLKNKCIEAEVRRLDNGFAWEVDIFSRQKRDSERVLAGTIKNIAIDGEDFRQKMGVVVHLPEGQNVLRNPLFKLKTYALGPSYLDIGMSGAFNPKVFGSSPPRKVFLKYNPDSITIMGVNRRKQPVIVYTYSNPLSSLLKGASPF